MESILGRQMGISYSAHHAPEESHEKINLGVLMDGITVMMTAEFLKLYTSHLDWRSLNDFEKIVIADINLDLDKTPANYRRTKFHQNVTIPTQKFINSWGGEELYRHLARAMLTGKTRELVKYFDSRTGRKNSWKQIFKSASY